MITTHEEMSIWCTMGFWNRKRMKCFMTGRTGTMDLNLNWTISRAHLGQVQSENLPSLTMKRYLGRFTSRRKARSRYYRPTNPRPLPETRTTWCRRTCTGLPALLHPGQGDESRNVSHSPLLCEKLVQVLSEWIEFVLKSRPSLSWLQKRGLPKGLSFLRNFLVRHVCRRFKIVSRIEKLFCNCKQILRVGVCSHCEFQSDSFQK